MRRVTAPARPQRVRSQAYGFYTSAAGPGGAQNLSHVSRGLHIPDYTPIEPGCPSHEIAFPIQILSSLTKPFSFFSFQNRQSGLQVVRDERPPSRDWHACGRV